MKWALYLVKFLYEIIQSLQSRSGIKNRQKRGPETNAYAIVACQM